MKKFIRIFDSVISVVVAGIMSLVVAGNFICPDNIVNTNSTGGSFDTVFTVDCNNVEKASKSSDGAVNSGKTNISLLGFVPVKDVSISSINSDKVIVSGEVFGIKIYTNGVMVVGTKDIDLAGQKVNPAGDSGIEVGDVIVAINNKNIYSSTDVEQQLSDNNGKDYRIKVMRDGEYKNFTLTPVYSDRDGCFKAGIWVRDSTAGIGTVTFYNPKQGTVATLGHPITDVDTDEIMPILKGEAVNAKVTKIYKSKSGSAGSLCCDFLPQSIGTLTENTNYGVYGKYSTTSLPSTVYEVAPAQEVEKGDCQILTTITTGKPQLYSAKVTHISYREDTQQKNMVIRICDKRLLNSTGGIVQGMSGSPIIQNGKLIGALTHVIVDNPKKGYAIFAVSMLKESENIR